MPGLPQTPLPTPGVNEGPPEPPNPGITISLLEIGSLPPFCLGSFPSPNNNVHPLGRPGTVQKFSNLLKDIKDALKNIAGFEEQTTDVSSTDDTSTSEGTSELKIRGIGKRNKMRFKDMVINFDLEKEENTKKQERILNNHSAKNMMQVYARNLCNAEERGWDDMQLSTERGQYGSPHIHGKHRRLRNNMEQLLQEADHWSRQHSELSELMKTYQECQKERREALENNHVYFQTQSSDEPSSKQELEEQVKKLSHDTHSLHLIAALLQNECQILQQRVDIFREFHLHKAGPTHEKPLQMHNVLHRKCPKSAEVGSMDANKQTMRSKESVFPRKEKIARSSDACLSKKARNNRFNTRVARKTLMGKRRTISSIR